VKGNKQFLAIQNTINLQHNNESINSNLVLNKEGFMNVEQELFLLNISRGVILSILIFGLFSYPLHILNIKLILIISLAIVTNIFSDINKTKLDQYIGFKKPTHIILNLSFYLVVLAILLLTANKLQEIRKSYKYWKSAYNLYIIGEHEVCLNDYEKAYPILKGNCEFMTNYCKALLVNEIQSKSLEILQQAAKCYSNPVIYIALGNSYKKLGDVSNAEQAYLHAWYMIPNLFYPKYLIAKLYFETGQKDKAAAIAYELLNKKVKIESMAIEEMKEEMKKMIKR
jgi:tetratricopeptide (TPR) repeat protein